MALKNGFRAAATEQGLLRRGSFTRVLKEMGFSTVPAGRLFNVFDKDGDGKLDYRDFLTGLVTLRKQGEEALKFCFSIYDHDGSGTITLQDLTAVLSAALEEEGETREDGDGDGDGECVIPEGTNEQAKETAAKLGEIFEMLDSNKNGRVTFADFKAGVEAEPLLVETFLRPARELSLGNNPLAGDPVEPPVKRPRQQQGSFDESLPGVREQTTPLGGLGPGHSGVVAEVGGAEAGAGAVARHVARAG
ncbi:unnamed protein product, partial [Discosporangium mesarthrocarpum]